MINWRKRHSFIVNVAYILAMLLIFGNTARFIITAIVGDDGTYSLTEIRALLKLTFYLSKLTINNLFIRLCYNKFKIKIY